MSLPRKTTLTLRGSSGLLQKQPHFRLDGPTRLKFTQELTERKTRMDWVRNFMRQLKRTRSHNLLCPGCAMLPGVYKLFSLHPIFPTDPFAIIITNRYKTITLSFIWIIVMMTSSRFTRWITVLALAATVAVALPARANTWPLPPAGSKVVGKGNRFHVVENNGGSLEAIAKKYNVGFSGFAAPTPALTIMSRALAAC